MYCTKGDILVADFEELEKMDASEFHARRLNAKEVLTPEMVIFCKVYGEGRSRMGTVSRGVHDRSAGRLASVPQRRRWTKRTVPARFFKEASGPESSEDDTESSNHAISCTSWCSPAACSRRRSPGSAVQSYSRRLALHSCSGPMRIGLSPSHPDSGDRFSSVLALTRNQDMVLRKNMRA